MIVWYSYICFVLSIVIIEPSWNNSYKVQTLSCWLQHIMSKTWTLVPLFGESNRGHNNRQLALNATAVSSMNANDGWITPRSSILSSTNLVRGDSLLKTSYRLFNMWDNSHNVYPQSITLYGEEFRKFGMPELEPWLWLIRVGFKQNSPSSINQ